MKWWTIGGGAVLLVGIIWFIRYLAIPSPGKELPDLGRQHVSAEEVAKTKYNSNPPTSGPHMETWVKPGIYDTPQKEGELIHSLEHGYIEIHYNCNATLGSQEGVTTATEEGKLSQATPSAINSGASCQKLIDQLSTLAHKKGLKKLIVVPRQNLDTTIALTAWRHIDVLNTFDAKRIEAFIDYYRDQGPEQTME